MMKAGQIISFLLVVVLTMSSSLQLNPLIEFEKDKNILTENGYAELKGILNQNSKWMRKPAYRTIFLWRANKYEYKNNPLINYERYLTLKDTLVNWGIPDTLVGLSCYTDGQYNSKNDPTSPTGLAFYLERNVVLDSCQKYVFEYKNGDNFDISDKNRLKGLLEYVKKVYHFQNEIIIINHHSKERKLIGFKRTQRINAEIVNCLKREKKQDGYIALSYFEGKKMSGGDFLIVYVNHTNH